MLLHLSRRGIEQMEEIFHLVMGLPHFLLYCVPLAVYINTLAQVLFQLSEVMTQDTEHTRTHT